MIVPGRKYFVAIALSCLLFGSCSHSPQPAGEQANQPPIANDAAAKSDAKQTLLVSAAASTKEVMEALAEKFTASTGNDVKINPGASSTLAAQIEAGAPADLFLSANQQWAQAVKDSGHAETMVPLLTNRLVIVVPAANPANVHDPKDLLASGVKKIALAGEKVPAGTYTDQALTKLDLLKPLTDAGKIVRGQDVRSALSYVERGEAEAGIVYSTDVGVASGVTTAYEFDPSLHDPIIYELVLLKSAGDNQGAKKLFDFLQSADADSVYRKFGFSRIGADAK
jgi:molybdate transport system substrate-binding protein